MGNKKSYQNIELFGGTIDIEFDETALLRFRTNKRICQLIFAKMSFIWTDIEQSEHLFPFKPFNDVTLITAHTYQKINM